MTRAVVPGAGRRLDPHAMPLHRLAPAGAGGEGDQVGEVDPPVVRLQLLRGCAPVSSSRPRSKSARKSRNGSHPSSPRRPPKSVERVAGDEQGGVGTLGGEPADAALPDLDPVRPGRVMKSWGRPALRVPARRGVGLAPAVVVLAGGEQEVGPPRVVRAGRRRARAPRSSAGEMGVVGLGDEPQPGAFRDDDHALQLTLGGPADGSKIRQPP